MAYIWRNTDWKMTTRLPPYETAIFAKAPCSHSLYSRERHSFALRVTAVNPFIGYSGQPEWGLSRDAPSLFTHSVVGWDRLPVILSFFTQCPINLQNKWRGLEGNYWVGADTSVYHAWPSGKGIKVAYHHRSDNFRFRCDAKKWTTPTPMADSRRRQMQVIERIIRNSGLCSEGHDVFIIRYHYFIRASTTSIDVEFQWTADYRACRL